jgi:uncharacterized Zn-binding protein involved in type VI secretion
MPPAARAGDQTSHGTPLAPGLGSSNVIIGGLPAWRIGIDTHFCPLVNILIPHGAGIVTMGSTTVFINNFPAVRAGDSIVECGPPNAILAGCATVLIG